MTKIALAGPGAFGRKHLDGLKKIDGAKVTAIVDPDADLARAWFCTWRRHGYPRLG